MHCCEVDVDVHVVVVVGELYVDIHKVEVIVNSKTVEGSCPVMPCNSNR